MSSPTERLRDEFGNIDVYVFDQLLRGNLTTDMTVLDAGCGGGRNLVWLARQGAEVHAVDRAPDAIERTRAAGVPAERAHVAELDALPYPDACFDAVLCNAVLHFADDEQHFARMVSELRRVLRSGGLLFARLASSIGIEERVEPTDRPRWFRLPDGSERFLVDEQLLLATTASMGAELVDPLKTTVVQGMRSMTTWVVRA